jgi:hypothetical protein
MSRVRLVVTALLTLALLGLFGWQMKREHLVKTCLEQGRAWTGRSCGPQRGRPILQRDLHPS